MIFWSCNCIYKFCKLAILQTFLSKIEEGIQNQSDCLYFMVFGSKIEILWINMHKKKTWKFCCWHSSPGWGTAGHVSKWASSNGTE